MFGERIPQYTQRLQQTLEKWLPAGSIHPIRLHQAMRYSALSGGKHFRPMLMYAAGETLRLEPELLDGPAAAIELIHAYSLIHDDLPAMDDDDLRRGQPTCHKAFDEATAILAGDALQALAFQVLASDSEMTRDPHQRARIIQIVADAIGSRGMAGGQAVDLEAQGRRLSPAELESMHIHKTGALIRASVLCACYSCPELADDDLAALDHYGKSVGLAFQIQDDILDETGTTESIGKRSGADRARGKPTYPALFGLQESKRLAGELIDSALESLGALGARAAALRWLAEYVIGRQR